MTLAAALALPAGGPNAPAFPYRDLVVFTAFAVVLGTLVLQGTTLRPLMAWLQLEVDDSVEREVRFARVETLRAALSAMEGEGVDEMSGLLRRCYELLLRRAQAEPGGVTSDPARATGSDGGSRTTVATVAHTVVAAERQRLLLLLAEGTIGDAAFQRVKQELDLKELDLQQFAPEGETRNA